MAIFYSPKIKPEDYDAFRRILHSHLPDTYNEWLYLQTQEAAENVNRGHTVRQIEVDPDEFARYCRATRATHNMQSLGNFAAKKSGGEQY